MMLGLLLECGMEGKGEVRVTSCDSGWWLRSAISAIRTLGGLLGVDTNQEAMELRGGVAPR